MSFSNRDKLMHWNAWRCNAQTMKDASECTAWDLCDGMYVRTRVCVLWIRIYCSNTLYENSFLLNCVHSNSMWMPWKGEEKEITKATNKNKCGFFCLWNCFNSSFLIFFPYFIDNCIKSIHINQLLALLHQFLILFKVDWTNCTLEDKSSSERSMWISSFSGRRIHSWCRSDKAKYKITKSLVANITILIMPQ